MRVEPHLPQQRLFSAMMGVLALLLSATEVLSGEFRAVTLEVGERRQFRVNNLGTVTGSSGRCLEESIDSEDGDSLWIEASCAGLRTSLLWRKDGSRLLVMACAEDKRGRTAAQVKTRQKVQGELKQLKSVTACVRNGAVELWGWVRTEGEGAQVQALAKRYGAQVRNRVEKVEAE